jgi:hypothetical protein
MIGINIDTSQVQSMLKDLSESVQGQVLARAIGKAADKGRTEMQRTIVREYNLSASQVRPQLKVKKFGRRLEAEIQALPAKPGRRSRNVILFLERKVTLAEAKRRRKAGTLNQLRFKFRRGRPGRQIPGAFVVTANKGTFVARRKPGTVAPSRSRYAGTKHAESLEAIHVIDVPQMFNARKVLASVKAKIESVYLPQEIERAIRDALKRYRR